MAFGLGYSLLTATKVIVFFTFVYIFIPSQIIRFREEETFLDRLFISLVHSNAITILIVHLLAFFKLYETFSLLFCYLATYLAVSYIRGRSPAALTDALGMKMVISILDMSEGRAGLKGELRKHLNDWMTASREKSIQLLSVFINKPFVIMLPTIVIIAAAVIRYRHPVIHAAYTHIDPYLHMYWVKCLGNNQIYNDGIYPYGYHAIISALVKLTFVDPYWLCRFMGPIAGILMVLSVYYFALRITKSHISSLLALVIYSLVTDGDFPAIVFRQTATLTQEYGAVFMLPGLYFLWLYLKSSNRSYLVLYVEALLITMMVHSYAAMYLIIWSAVLTLATILIIKVKVNVILNLIIFGFLGGIISLIPFGVGLLMGKGFHQSSAQFIQESISSGGVLNLTGLGEKMITGNPFLDISLAIIIVILISQFLLWDRDWAVFSITVSICSLFMYFLFRAGDLDLPELTDPTRTSVFFSLMLATLYVVGLNFIEKCFFKIKWKFSTAIVKAISLVVCVIIITFYPPGELFRGIREYDAAAENYLVIKNRYPTLNWTIIGPPEQLYQVVGSGWHYEILRFVRNYSMDQAEDPEFRLPIPTNHTFVFTEKRPLHFERNVTAKDAETELEPESGDPFIQYYNNKDQRAIIEAKAIRWMEAYMDSHKDVSVFYEDNHMKIYYIYQDLKKASK